MDSEELESVIAASPITVHPGTHTIATLRRWPKEPMFSVSSHGDEITGIALDGTIPEELVAQQKPGYRLLTAHISKPFAAPGFIAAIANALATRGINVYIVSLFSADCILVTQHDIDAAVEALRGRGFAVSDDNVGKQGLRSS